MHLAYLDDSGSDAKSPIAVFGGVVIPDYRFFLIEGASGWVVEKLIPEDRLDKFEEFHAAQLFWGEGVFAGLAQDARYDAIGRLLSLLGSFHLPYIYSAVDKKRLANGPFASSNPIDVAFRLCAVAIEEWLGRLQPEPVPYLQSPFDGWNGLALFVLDQCDASTKHALQKGYRQLRQRMRGVLMPGKMADNRLWHLHDDMYFGDSKDSIGIQLADICNYFMMRKLRGEDDGVFYDALKPHAICAKTEPDFSLSKQWLITHECC